MSNDIAARLWSLSEDINGEGDSYDDANTCAEGAILIRKQAATIAELESLVKNVEVELSNCSDANGIYAREQIIWRYWQNKERDKDDD